MFLPCAQGEGLTEPDPITSSTSPTSVVGCDPTTDPQVSYCPPSVSTSPTSTMALQESALGGSAYTELSTWTAVA
jgi:hypothetical protein